MKDRAKIIICLCIGLFIVTSTLSEQFQQTDSTSLYDQLVKEQKVMAVKSWKVGFYHCKTLFPRNCAEVDSYENLTVPSTSFKKFSAKAKSEGANNAIFYLSLDEVYKRFLITKKAVAIVIPQVLAQSVKLQRPMKQAVAGVGVDAHFSLPARMLLQKGEIELEFDYRGFDFTGPADLHIAITELGSVRAYNDLVFARDTQAKFTRLFEVGLPAVLTPLGLVLDHADSLAALLPFAVLKGLRSYVYSKENRSSLIWLLFVLNCFYFPFLGVAVLRILQIRYVKSQVLSVFGLGFLVQCIVYSRFDYLMVSDLATDITAAGGSLGLIGINGYLHLKRRDKFVLEKKNLIPAFVLVVAGLVLSLIANMQDAFAVANLDAKNFANPLHFTLVPLLASASLVGMGSVEEFARRIRLQAIKLAGYDKNVSFARGLQQSLMPENKGSFGGVRWRNFRYPSRHLSGDCHDIKYFKSGEKEYLVMCVIDIRGHGIGSSIYVTTALTAFSNWCHDLEHSISHRLADETETKDKILSEAPYAINKSFLSLRNNENCTACIALVDIELKEITFSHAGHPGFFLVSSEGKPRYLFAPGPSIGANPDLVADDWKTKTIKCEGSWQLIGYSDGIQPPGSDFSRWCKKVVKNKDSKAIVYDLLVQIWKNKKAFRLDESLEDDMTMVVIEADWPVGNSAVDSKNEEV